MAIKSIQKSFVFFDFSWDWFSLFLDFDRFWVATCRTLLDQPDLPETKTPIRQKLIPGPAECAKRSAALRGRRAESFDPGLFVLPSPSPWTKFLTQMFWAAERLSYPSLILPRRPAHSARPCPHSAAFALLAPLGRKNGVPRGLQKIINFWCPFNIDVGAFWLRFGGGKMAPKSIKINKNRVSEPFCFHVVFYIDFSMILAPNFDPLDLQKVSFA